MILLRAEVLGWRSCPTIPEARPVALALRGAIELGAHVDQDELTVRVRVEDELLVEALGDENSRLFIEVEPAAAA